MVLVLYNIHMQRNNRLKYENTDKPNLNDHIDNYQNGANTGNGINNDTQYTQSNYRGNYRGNNYNHYHNRGNQRNYDNTRQPYKADTNSDRRENNYRGNSRNYENRNYGDRGNYKRVDNKRQNYTSPVGQVVNVADSYDKELKTNAINYLYKNIDLSKYRYKILETEMDLELLGKDIEHVAPIFSGTVGILMFFKKFDNYYSVLINKVNLSYSINKLDYENVQVYKIKVHVDSNLYLGTIIEGTCLSNKDFLITDVYMFCGKNYSDKKLINKLLELKSSLVNNKSTGIDDINMYVNILNNVRDINTVISKDIPSLKNANYVKGVAFYPSHSGNKLFYFYNNNIHDVVTKENHLIGLTNSSSNNIVSAGNRIFKIKKTDVTDVYELYNEDKIEGIAYIPTLLCSKYCKLKTSEVGEFNGECTFDIKKQKWIPIIVQ